MFMRKYTTRKFHIACPNKTSITSHDSTSWYHIMIPYRMTKRTLKITQIVIWYSHMIPYHSFWRIWYHISWHGIMRWNQRKITYPNINFISPYHIVIWYYMAKHLLRFLFYLYDIIMEFEITWLCHFQNISVIKFKFIRYPFLKEMTKLYS